MTMDSACVADTDADANPISDDVYTPDEGSGQAESDDTAGRSQQGCAYVSFTCLSPASKLRMLSRQA